MEKVKILFIDGDFHEYCNPFNMECDKGLLMFGSNSNVYYFPLQNIKYYYLTESD